MLEHLISFSILRMSKVFDVSRSGFYHWLKNRHNASPRELARHALDNHVKKAFVDGKERDGARRIKVALEEGKHPYNIKTISQSMKRQGLVAKAGRQGSSNAQRIAIILKQFPRTSWLRTSMPQGQIRNGREISPTLQRAKAGCIWQ